MRYHCVCANSVLKAITMCAVGKLPVKDMGGYKLGGHVLQCLVTNIITIKLRHRTEGSHETSKHTAHMQKQSTQNP